MKHEICDYIQCSECINIPMPMRLALKTLLGRVESECKHENQIFTMQDYKCISKKCTNCGINL